MKILLISHSSLKKGPRQYRQIKALSNYEIHTVGLEKSGIETKFFKIKKYNFFIKLIRLVLLKFNLYKIYFWNTNRRTLYNKLKKNKYKLIIVHEIRMAPLAFKLSNHKIPVILDAHEYSPENFNDNFFWRFFIKNYYFHLCTKYLKRFNEIITVSDGIVEKYNREFNINCILINNATEYISGLKPIETKGKIKIIHHGIVSSSRSLDLIIDMMNYLDPNLYELNLMLVSSISRSYYLQKLKLKSKNKNIKFLKPVKREEIVSFCNNFDIGIIFFPPTNFNLKFGLGNKFFEYIQSRLCLVIGPDIEMSQIIKKYKLGVICNTWNPVDLARKISDLTLKDINYYKNQSNKYSKELSSINNIKTFKNLIKKYL
tara:strand:- start:6665 stop:7780 length:1116 start_codon:yes stop_codon:yes gene_type:complete